MDTYLGAAIIGSSANISSRGFNVLWGTSLGYCGPGGGLPEFGGSWKQAELTGLTTAGGTVSYSPAPGRTKQFVPSGGGAFQATYFVRDVLTQIGGNYTLVSPDGSSRYFDSAGKLTGFKSPGEVNVQVTRDGGGLVTSVNAEAGEESWEYAYEWNGPKDRITAIVYKVDGRSVLKAVYAYEASTGWLQTIKVFENSEPGGEPPDWGTVSISAERFTYHENGQLRHVIPPTEYRQMEVNGLAPDTTTNMTVLNEYAETEYEYQAGGRVSKMYTHGRRYELGFAYTNGTVPGDVFNTWRLKAEVSRPGDVRETFYLSGVGQVILKRMEQLDATGDALETWYPVFQSFKTDGSARLDYTADARAIIASSFNESTGKLVNLEAHAGLITTYSYNVYGLKEYLRIKEGTAGTPVTLRRWTYGARSTSLGTVRPLASELVYHGTGYSLTSYSYLWHGTTFQPSRITTSLPLVPEGENGTNTSQSRQQHFDQLGFLTKEVDTSGVATTYDYRKATGGLTQKIADQGTGKLNFTTDYEVDDLGRTILELGPLHTIDLAGVATAIRTGNWTYYKDREGEVWTFGGYREGVTDNVVGAVTVARKGLEAPAGYSGWGMNETIAASYDGSGLPDQDTPFATLFPRETWQSWTLGLIDKAGELKGQWTYWEIPASGYGTLDGDHGRKLYGYDVAGRQNETTCPGGTTDKTTYNAMGWPVQEELGTLVSGLTVTRVNEYDAAGNLTKATLPVDGTPANDRVIDYVYDFRSRRTQESTTVEKDGGGTWTLIRRIAYDNRDLPTSVTTYHTSVHTGNRTGYQTMAYDSRSRRYRTSIYAADSDNYPQISNLYYDGEDRVVKDAPSGSKLYTVTGYDAVGRVVKVSQAYDATSSSSSSPPSSSSSLSASSSLPSSLSGSSSPPFAMTSMTAASLSDAIVMEQQEHDYDDASNLISMTARQRFDDATGTGDLQDADTQPTARVSYVASYPDPLGRTQAVANYGTNNGSWSRSGTIPARTGVTPQPEVSSYTYDGVGNVITQTDPAGIVARQTWDKASRLTELVENWLVTPGDDTRTTRYEYTPDGWMTKLISLNPDTSASGEQVTEWIYGVGPAQGSALYSKRLVYQKVFPDESGTANRVTYTYSRQLQVTGMTDQLGTIHVYTLDKLGRLTADTVTSFGSGVDNAVGKLATGYDAKGLISRATSYNAAGTTVLNEIAWDYNGFNQAVAEYQEHSGAVNRTTSLKVGYTYANGSANTLRPTGIKHPHVGSGSAAVVDWNYATSMADALSRISSIQQSGSILSDWRYVGLGMVVGQTYPAATNTALSYGISSATAANAYTGYDRFGRIVETIWKTGSTEQVHSKYGRNAVGGVVWRKDVKAASILGPTTQDDYYEYDGLYQVTHHDRGQLTPGSPPFSGVTNTQQQEVFTYDETGNWKGYDSETPSLAQTRGHNVANQITGITNPSGVIQPSYDPTGNIRAMPDPQDWTNQFDCKWDAWNRLVEINDGGATVQANTYDARTRRIKMTTAAEIRDYYFDNQWRALEERVSGTVKADYVYNPYDRWNLIRRRRSVSGTLDETRFALRDSLDAVAIVTTAGAVDERYGYDAFGPVRIMEPDFDPRTASICAWNWLFHGEFLDSETGLYNYGYRYYHPQLGRWISRDPIGEEGGLNLYGFVGNNPLDATDYLGAKCHGNCIKANITKINQIKVKNLVKGGECPPFLTEDLINKEIEGSLADLKKELEGQGDQEFSTCRDDGSGACNCEYKTPPVANKGEKNLGNFKQTLWWKWKIRLGNGITAIESSIEFKKGWKRCDLSFDVTANFEGSVQIGECCPAKKAIPVE